MEKLGIQLTHEKNCIQKFHTDKMKGEVILVCTHFDCFSDMYFLQIILPQLCPYLIPDRSSVWPKCP